MGGNKIIEEDRSNYSFSSAASQKSLTNLRPSKSLNSSRNVDLKYSGLSRSAKNIGLLSQKKIMVAQVSPKKPLISKPLIQKQKSQTKGMYELLMEKQKNQVTQKIERLNLESMMRKSRDLLSPTSGKRPSPLKQTPIAYARQITPDKSSRQRKSRQERILSAYSNNLLSPPNLSLPFSRQPLQMPECSSFDTDLEAQNIAKMIKEGLSATPSPKKQLSIKSNGQSPCGKTEQKKY